MKTTPQLVRIRGYLIPDASMIVTAPQWFTVWTQSSLLRESTALKRGISRIVAWGQRLALGSHQGIVRVRLHGTNGAPFFDAAAPGHAEAGEHLTQHRETPPLYSVGSLVVEFNPANPRAVIIERLEAITGDQSARVYWLETLYLGKSFARNRTVTSLYGFATPTEAQHEQARTYAAAFRGDEPAGGKPAQTDGGEKSSTRGARPTRGKRSISHSSAAAMRETQNGSDREQASQSAPSQVATSDPPALSSSTTAASESRKPKPKKRRIPRDQVN